MNDDVQLLGISNAIVDVLAHVEDKVIESLLNTVGEVILSSSQVRTASGGSGDATEFGSQRKRHWNSGRATWPKRKPSMAALSSGGRSPITVVNIEFTNSALRPVTGWVRTTG